VTLDEDFQFNVIIPVGIVKLRHNFFRKSAQIDLYVRRCKKKSM